MSTPSYSPSESPFVQQVRRTLRLKHMSRRTEKSYLYYILDYIPVTWSALVMRELSISIVVFIGIFGVILIDRAFIQL